MRKALLCTSAALLLAAAAHGQVSWTVRPSPVPTEQVITLVISNMSGSTITLQSTAPWSIRDSLGGLVYGPMGLWVLVPLSDKQAKAYTWDQKDSNNAFVKPAAYQAWVDYYDAKSQKHTLKTPFRIDPDKLTVTGQPAPGAIVKLMLSSPGAPQQPYVAAVALSTGPELPIGGNRLLALTPDALFVLSLLAGPPIFRNFSGNLDASGAATATLAIPNIGSLKGLTLYAAHVTLNAAAPSGILGYSAPQAIRIQ